VQPCRGPASESLDGFLRNPVKPFQQAVMPISFRSSLDSPLEQPDSNSRSHVGRIAVWRRAVAPTPPARRGTNPKRDGRFESDFLQRRVCGILVPNRRSPICRLSKRLEPIYEVSRSSINVLGRFTWRCCHSLEFGQDRHFLWVLGAERIKSMPIGAALGRLM